MLAITQIFGLENGHGNKIQQRSYLDGFNTKIHQIDLKKDWELGGNFDLCIFELEAPKSNFLVPFLLPLQSVTMGRSMDHEAFIAQHF